ncbi:MAG: type II secretion system protein GspG [Myxococcaceae bacterium]|nr:type II secretion system protein GspG [Myxococcaceae bacterium]MCI0673559.1 type II secretion system protein GspG [Myxococcaceae bacterium]
MHPESDPTATSPATSPRRSPWGVRLAVTGVMLAAAALALGIGHLRKLSLEELKTSPTARARADIIYLERLVRHYMRVVGTPPTTEQGLKALVEARVVGSIPQDPWGRPYIYEETGGVGRITSLGRDGREGGEGEDADIRARGP